MMATCVRQRALLSVFHLVIPETTWTRQLLWFKFKIKYKCCLNIFSDLFPTKVMYETTGSVKTLMKNYIRKMQFFCLRINWQVKISTDSTDIVLVSYLHVKLCLLLYLQGMTGQEISGYIDVKVPSKGRKFGQWKVWTPAWFSIEL